MKKMLLWLWHWLPPLGLMAIIFYLSSQHSIQVSTNKSEDFFAHKLVHVIEYGVLTFLFIRALYLTYKKKIPLNKQLLIAAACALLFGVSDEVHQLFVPTRTGHIRDVFIDGIGISIVVLYTRYHIDTVKKILF